MLTTIPKQLMLKKYDNSFMFQLPPIGKYKNCFFFQNKNFVKQDLQNGDFEIENYDNFKIQVYKKGGNGATQNISVQELNKEYRIYNNLIKAEWEITKKQGEDVLLSVDLQDDGEYFLVTQKNAIQNVAKDVAKINRINDDDVISNSYDEVDYYFQDRGVKKSAGLSEKEEQAYQEYLSGVKERIKLSGATEQWFDCVMSRLEWVEFEKQFKEQNKIKKYVNEKTYEKTTPYALRTRRQFVCWKWAYDEKREKAIKLPMNPTQLGKLARSNDSWTWGTFDKCCTAVNEYGDKFGFAGVGIMFGDGIMGIDFDHCVKDGKVKPEIDEIVRAIGSYTEYSPSGDGLHVLLFGEVPKGYGNRNDAKGVECYDTGRFFTLTGKVYDRTLCKIKKRVDTEEALNEFAKRFLTAKKESCSQVESEEKCANLPKTERQGQLKLNDEEIIAKIRCGNRKGAFASLFDKGEVPLKSNGLLNVQCMKVKNSTSEAPKILLSNDEILKYYEKDHSSCDACLCGIIAGYTDSPEQLDRIFRKSALMRDKWDSRRGSTTYGEILCQTTIKQATWKYKGKRLYSYRKGQMSVKLDALQDNEVLE